MYVCVCVCVYLLYVLGGVFVAVFPPPFAFCCALPLELFLFLSNSSTVEKRSLR